VLRHNRSNYKPVHGTTSTENIHRTVCFKILTDKGIASFRDGLCGSDAFRDKAEGIPKHSETDPAVRKEQVLRAVIFMAQHRMLEKFNGMYVQLLPWHYSEKKRLPTI
jgi:hypothetical protein